MTNRQRWIQYFDSGPLRSNGGTRTLSHFLMIAWTCRLCGIIESKILAKPNKSYPPIFFRDRSDFSPNIPDFSPNCGRARLFWSALCSIRIYCSYKIMIIGNRRLKFARRATKQHLKKFKKSYCIFLHEHQIFLLTVVWLGVMLRMSYRIFLQTYYIFF
jgi:hypothetical protein